MDCRPWNHANSIGFNGTHIRWFYNDGFHCVSWDRVYDRWTFRIHLWDQESQTRDGLQ